MRERVRPARAGRPAAPGQRDAGLGRLARQPGGDRAPAQATGRLRRDDHVHVGQRRARPSAPAQHPLGRDQHRCRARARGATRGRPVPRPAGPGRRRAGRSRPAGCGAPPAGSRSRRRPRHGRARRGGPRPASRAPSGGASAQSRTAMPGAGGRASVTGRRASHADSAAAIAVGRRATPAAVMSSASSPSGTCVRRSCSSSTTTEPRARALDEPHPQVGGDSVGSTVPATVAQVGDVHALRPQPLQQPGRAAERGAHAAAPCRAGPAGPGAERAGPGRPPARRR